MPKNILLIRFGSLGDVILSSATALNLKLAYPKAKLTFLTKASYAPIVERFDGVDEVIALEASATLGQYYQLLQALDCSQFDLVIDLHRKFRSWLARKLISSNQTVVYPKRRVERRAAVRRYFKKLPESWPHTIDLYNSVLEQLEGEAGEALCQRPMISLDRTEGRSADRPRHLFVAPGAAHPTKAWPAEKFAEVSRRLIELGGTRVTWGVTSAERPEKILTESLDPGQFTLLVDEPLLKLADCIASADLTLCNDSGLMHLSSAVGTPAVALFGPTHPLLGFAPRGLMDQQLGAELPCRPCSLHGGKACFQERQFCFDKIEVESVTRTVIDALEESSALSPALLVDRDGTIIVEKDFLADPEQVQLIEGSAEALRLAISSGYRVVILSNQSGVARGFFTIEEVEAVNTRLLELLAAEQVEVDGVYYCPYYEGGTVPEYRRASRLRKPRPGMAEAAALELSLDLRRSIVIGDKLADLTLGRVIGGRSALVATGHGREEYQRLVDQSGPGEILHDNLLQAVQVMVSEKP